MIDTLTNTGIEISPESKSRLQKKLQDAEVYWTPQKGSMGFSSERGHRILSETLSLMTKFPPLTLQRLQNPQGEKSGGKGKINQKNSK